jgi:tRNA(Met) C34 N-acetyltransferase TmcA
VAYLAQELHLAAVGPALLPSTSPDASLNPAPQERQDRRETWNEHFAEIVNTHFRNLPSLDVLGDMPEHCIKETVANKVMLLLGSCIMVLQAVTVYFALNTLFSIPMKQD